MITREEYCRILANQEQEETIMPNWFVESCDEDMRCELMVFMTIPLPTGVQAMASRFAAMAMRSLLLKEYEHEHAD